MERVVLYGVVAGLGTWFITLLGAFCVMFFKKTDQKVMNVMLGFAAGVMIAASFWSLLSPAIEKMKIRGVELPWEVVFGFLFGAFFMWASDKVVSLMRVKTDEVGGGARSKLFMLILSITLHNIPEGLSVGVAFGALGKSYTAEALMGAIVISVGIGLQNFPEGVAVSLPMRREGYPRWKCFLVGQATALVEPVFALIGGSVSFHVERILPFALSFAAGAMILVAVHDIIPECQKENSLHPYVATFGIVAGFAAMMILDVFLS